MRRSIRRLNVLGLYCEKSCRLCSRSIEDCSEHRSPLAARPFRAGKARAAWPARARCVRQLGWRRNDVDRNPRRWRCFGIESNWAESGCCTSVRPPALIACRPSVPSAPMPDNTTPMACSPWSRASERTACRSATACRAAALVWSVSAVPPDAEFGVRRNHIDRSGSTRIDFPLHAPASWSPLQQFGQQGLLRGIEMLHHDVGQAAVAACRRELLQRLQAAGRSAEADDAGPGKVVRPAVRPLGGRSCFHRAVAGLAERRQISWQTYR